MQGRQIRTEGSVFCVLLDRRTTHFAERRPACGKKRKGQREICLSEYGMGEDGGENAKIDADRMKIV